MTEWTFWWWLTWTLFPDDNWHELFSLIITDTTCSTKRRESTTSTITTQARTFIDDDIVYFSPLQQSHVGRDCTSVISFNIPCQHTYYKEHRLEQPCRLPSTSPKSSCPYSFIDLILWHWISGTDFRCLIGSFMVTAGIIYIKLIQFWEGLLIEFKIPGIRIDRMIWVLDD